MSVQSPPPPTLTQRKVAITPPADARGWQRLPAVLRYAIIIVGLIALWQAYITLGHVPRLLFASPYDVAVAIVDRERAKSIRTD